jgi:phosphoserine phosphatase RsbX
MQDMKIREAHLVEACAGELESGDAVVVELSEGRSLFAVIDGLGHGPAAAQAARAAVSVMRAKWREGDLNSLMLDVHAKLHGTRGAAATLCLIEGDKLTCCGVGNVALRSYGMDVPFMLSPGILGKHVRTFRFVAATLARSLRIVLHSDGIESQLALASFAQLSPHDACAAIFRKHRKFRDDGAVMVIDVGE